jgi:hypothetical protein
MPVADALRLGNFLLGTDFRDHVARRWRRGSWRMRTPVINADHGVGPADTAQIRLPKDQVPDLIRTLERRQRESLRIRYR